ncbi:serine threonine protein [Colletotrichum tofieldiae]|uniref:Serine threonine protein n=1 Tax=Colletotrichum tofieldiae TaxID=708197 RepID=A0A166MTH8_9PEZI|nr:serine threonine protein [Colletotrichum tofieldiae]
MSDKASNHKQTNLVHEKRPRHHFENQIHQIEPLRLVKAKQEGSSALATTLIKTASPWATYKKIYKQILGDGDLVLVAEKRGISGDVVDIRRFLELSTEQIKMLQSIQHPNIVTVHEIYSDKTNHHIVYEHMPRSLQEAVGNPYLNRYAKEGVNLGLDDPEHWDSDVVGFLSATTSASSANELSQVGLTPFCFEAAANMHTAFVLTFLA